MHRHNKYQYLTSLASNSHFPPMSRPLNIVNASGGDFRLLGFERYCLEMYLVSITFYEDTLCTDKTNIKYHTSLVSNSHFPPM